MLTQKIPVATPKSVNWDWVFLGFFGSFKFPNWDWVFLGFLGLGFFGFFFGFFGIFWDFLGFLNFQIGIGFFRDWDFLGFFGFFKFPNWDCVFFGVFLGLGFFGVFLVSLGFLSIFLI